MGPDGELGAVEGQDLAVQVAGGVAGQVDDDGSDRLGEREGEFVAHITAVEDGGHVGAGDRGEGVAGRAGRRTVITCPCCHSAYSYSRHDVDVCRLQPVQIHIVPVRTDEPTRLARPSGA